MSALNKVVLLGSGVVGGQISFHSAYEGKAVTVYDISADALGARREDHKTYAAVYSDRPRNCRRRPGHRGRPLGARHQDGRLHGHVVAAEAERRDRDEQPRRPW